MGAAIDPYLTWVYFATISLHYWADRLRKKGIASMIVVSLITLNIDLVRPSGRIENSCDSGTITAIWAAAEE